MSQVEFRRATAADLVAYYGAPPSPTVRAWVGLVDGVAVGMGGLRYHRGQPLEVFMDLKPEARKHPKAILRACRTVLRELRGVPARVVADPDEPRAAKLLGRLGLKPIGTVAGLEVFTT